MSTQLDPAILAALPQGSKVTYIDGHGSASWSSGYRLEVEVEGQEQEYFLKIISRPNHTEMALGEFESQKALSQHVPDNAVIPLAYGTMELDSSKSFFLTTFRELNDNKCPDENEVAAVLSALHRSSSSPTGKFGFHVQTFNGWAPMVNGWYDTWEEYFSRQLRSDFEWTENIRGPDAEFSEVAAEFFSKVVPRLLRPLQTEGRSIRPVLLHGDVYSGNMKLDINTSKVILFDSCCCYGHNEMDLSMMRQDRYLFSEGGYMEKYLAAMGGPSEPTEDFDDRNAIYAMRDDIINAGLHDHRLFLRDHVKSEMKRLIAKYPQGYDSFAKQKHVQSADTRAAGWSKLFVKPLQWIGVV